MLYRLDRAHLDFGAIGITGGENLEQLAFRQIR